MTRQPSGERAAEQHPRPVGELWAEPDEEQIDPYALRGSANASVEKITLKHGDAFLVADGRGDLPTSEQETGLYWHGTRYLRSCDVFLGGQPLIPLSYSISDEAGTCQIDLTNPFLRTGAEEIYQGTIHVRRLLELHGATLIETLILTSFHSQPHPLDVTLGLKLDADFRDIFEVRGFHREARGEQRPPLVAHDSAVLSYRGLDEITRTTILTFVSPASQVLPQGIFWNLTLEQGTPVEMRIVTDLRAERPPQRVDTYAESSGELFPPGRKQPLVKSDNVFFNRLLTRGMHDLEMMSTRTDDGLYPYGGIPWYVCPFGRDALITSLEFLPWYPQIARGTLAFLATHQGKKEDPFTEEQPGRILHEYRQGELANCREIPFIPYYGTIDATPLFLITLEAYVRWSNDMAFLRRHWPNALAAARWMRDYGDCDGDSFLEYQKLSEKGLVNQGWKDSWDAVSHEDGTLAQPPIALCEVQAYAYAAYRAICYLAERLGEQDEIAEWRQRAETLRAHFLERFWWPEEQVFYLALDGNKQPCKVVTSNAGQCLWGGIASQEQADAVVNRLMRPDMYTHWGIRTLSRNAARYNPMSYHDGSVWPHDTALVGAGFARYGHKVEAGKLLGHLFGVSLHYAGERLPELFCGFDRIGGYAPTRYPVACAPQSWAAGSPFLLLSAMLSFAPEAEHQRLTLRAPMLPEWMHELELGHLRLGNHKLHLCFEQAAHGTSVILEGSSEIEVSVVRR